MSLVTLKEKVEQLVDKVEDLSLPNWDDYSPIIATAPIESNTNCYWELTEKGTFKLKLKDVSKNSKAHVYTTGASVGQISLDYLEIAPKIKQVYVSDGITSFVVGYIPNCERIRMPDSLTDFPLPFSACVQIKDVDFSQYGVTTMPKYWWQNAQNLERITLPHLITKLSDYAFSGCFSLKKINIDNITTFGNACFNECFSLNRDIVFHENLTSIETQAFYRTRIKSVKFQNSIDSLPTIASNAFGQCRELLDIYVPWAEGEVANAPWGATNAKIWYGVAYVENDIPYDKDGNPIEQEV